MEVRFKKLVGSAVIPTKAHASDAGFDLVATSVTSGKDGEIVYHTGLALEIPDGYVGLIFPRSSIASRGIMLTNCVGVCDACYRGEVMAKFRPITKDYVAYAPGERIAQLIIMPYPSITFVEASELSESERGEGGYGSTGR